MASKDKTVDKQSPIRLCVPLCPHFIMGGDTQFVCGCSGLRRRNHSSSLLLGRSSCTADKRLREGQSLTVILFQRLLDLMAAAYNVTPFALLYR